MSKVGYDSSTRTFSTHTHSWSAAASGNTITTVCNGSGTCAQGYNTARTLTLNASSATYDGGSHGASTSGEYYSEAGAPGSIYYEGVSGTTYAKTTTAPTNAGSYRASITLGGKTATKDFTINRAGNPLSYTGTQSVTKTFSTSSQTATLTAASNGQGTVTYAIQSQPSGNYFSLNGTTLTLAANTPVGTYSVVVRASAAGNGNYNSGYKDSTVTVTVNRANISPSVSMSGWTYGATASDPSVSGNTGGGAVTYEYKTQGAADATYTTTRPSNAGTYTVRATIAQTTNYNVGTATANFTISKAGNPLSYTGTQSVTKTFSTSSQTATLTAASNGQGTVTYAIQSQPSGNYFSLNGTTLTLAANTPVGTYSVVVRASAAGNGNYNSGYKDSTVTVTVNRANITPAVSMSGWTYGETPSEPSVSGNSGNGTVTYAYKVKDADDGTYTATKPTNAGSYTVRATVAQTANYNDGTATANFTVSRANITPGVSMSGWTYGETAPEPVVTGNTESGEVTYLYAGTSCGGAAYSASVPPTNAGEYTVTATIAQTANYNSATTATADFTVAKKPATVTVNGGQSKTYGEDDPALTATVTGTVNSETLNYTLARAAGENAGEYAVTVTPGENPNYDVTATNGTFTIAKKPATVTADAKSKTYGEDDPALTATVEGTVGGDTLNYSLTRAAGENVVGSPYAITVTLGENPNYDVTATNGTFTVAKKSATVTADAKSKTYGDADPALTATVTGTVGSETLNYTLSRAAGDSVGDYTITVALGDNPNYDVTATNNTFTINQKAATVTADAKSKYFDDADPELTATVEGTVGSDTLSYTLSRAAGENAGEYAVTVTPGENPNYNVTKTDSTLTINKKPAPASLTNDQKPTPVEGLSETGGQHVLLDPPSDPLDGYTPEYSIDGGTSWDTDIPTAKEKGTYTVKVRYRNDDNHEPYTGTDELSVTIGRQQDDIVLNSPTGVKLTIDNRNGSTMKDILDGAKDEGSVNVTDNGSQTTTVTVEVSIELNVELEQNAANIADATGTTEETAYKASQIAEVYDVSLQKITTTTTVVTNNSDGSLISKGTASGAPVPVPYSGGSIMITIPFVKSNPSAAYSVVYYDGAGNYEDMHANYENGAFVFYTTHTSTYFIYSDVPTASTVANDFTVALRPTGTDGRTYDIILNAPDGFLVNRFTSADLTFSLSGTEGNIVYEVAPNSAAYIKLNDALRSADRYEFYADGVNYSDVSGKSITLGTVTFGGYGKGWRFEITNAVVNTTKWSDNVVTTTTSDALVTMLNIGATTTADNPTALIDPLTLNPDTKNLTVNVTFPNGIQDNASAYQDMTLTVTGGDLTQEIVVKLGQTASIADITPNVYPYGKDAKTTATALQTGDYNYGAATLTADVYEVTLTQILTLNTMYTVTVSGAGYRTARYNVLMDDNKTLTFWNNVMDAATVVETEKDSSAVQVTYLAGDIVEDAQINVYDLSAVVSYFGTTSPDIDVSATSPYAKYDLNRDGKIDSIDVAYVLVSWGK